MTTILPWARCFWKKGDSAASGAMVVELGGRVVGARDICELQPDCSSSTLLGWLLLPTRYATRRCARATGFSTVFQPRTSAVHHTTLAHITHNRGPQQSFSLPFGDHFKLSFAVRPLPQHHRRSGIFCVAAPPVSKGRTSRACVAYVTDA